MNEYLIIMSKTALFFFILIFTMRFMGKREVGELSVFDLVVFFVISELLSISIATPEENPLQTISAIAVLVFLQKILAIIVLKSKKMRNLIDGQEVYIIKDGVIDQEAMRKNRYNIDDLMMQLRQKDIDTPSKVKYAVLETDGSLSVIEKEKNAVPFPSPVIRDGEIDEEVLNSLNITKEWLINELSKYGHKDYQKIFLCLVEDNGLFIVPKKMS
ncbi:TPA: DUF421 domain-containing protein [bacterium]|nr:DUF421 domain-containing protein [bacterium]